MTTAKFITLDGIDGAGKTTQLAFIKQWFEERQLPVYFSREPGGTPLGEQLRQLLLNPQTQISLETETLLMFAARSQHLNDVIYPKLKQGIHVVCDRFTDATFAYQGGGRGLAWEKIEILEQWLHHDFQADLTILLDVPLSVSMQRIENTREKDRFEQEQASFFQKVRAAYFRRVESAPHRYCVIDNHRALSEVQSDIQTALNHLFSQ